MEEKTEQKFYQINYQQMLKVKLLLQPVIQILSLREMIHGWFQEEKDREFFILQTKVKPGK